jgi:hypothetical protein
MLPLGTTHMHHYATSTITSQNSRKRFVQKMLAMLQNNNPPDIEIDRYLNTQNVSDEYKVAIIKTYQQMYPTNNIPDLKKYRNSKKKAPIADRENLKIGIELLLTTAARFLVDLKHLKLNTAHQYSSSYIETMVAICITAVTNLRSNEVLNLSILDLGKMLRGERISIRIKARQHLTAVIPHPRYKDMYPYIINALAESYDVRKSDKTYTQRFLVPNAKETFIKNPDSSELATSKAFLSTSTIINRNISNIYLNLTKKAQKNIGLKAIRTYNTTSIINAGSTEIAQIFNRHSTKHITETYYNLPAPISEVNAIYEDMKLDSLIEESQKKIKQET